MTDSQDIVVLSNEWYESNDSKHSHSTAERIFHQFMLWSSGIAGAISLSPFLLSSLNIKGAAEANRHIDRYCCNIIAGTKPFFGGKDFSFSQFGGSRDLIADQTFGLAGLLTHAYAKIPGVGYHLATGVLPEPINHQLRKIPRVGNHLAEMKLANALAAGGVILLGQLSAAAIEKYEARKHDGEDEEHHEPSKAARMVRNTSMGIGMFIALPTMLAGVGHAVLVANATFNPEQLADIKNPHGIGAQIAGFLGKPLGDCGGPSKAPASASAAGLLGLCCTIPAAITATTTVFSALTGTSQKQSATRRPQGKVSFYHYPLDKMAELHHDMPIEQMEQEVTAMEARLLLLEKETKRSAAVGNILSWGLRGAAAAGTLIGVNKWASRATLVNDDGTIDTRELESSVADFETQQALPPQQRGRAALTRAPNWELKNRTLPLIDDPAGKPQIDSVREAVKNGWPIDFKFIPQDKPMANNGRGGGGCCTNFLNDCCVDENRYYNGDKMIRIVKAARQLLGSLPKPGSAGTASQQANPLVLLGGSLLVNLGAWSIARKIEDRFVTKPQQTLDRFRARTEEARGLLAHMKRDYHDMPRSHAEKLDMADEGHSR